MINTILLVYFIGMFIFLLNEYFTPSVFGIAIDLVFVFTWPVWVAMAPFYWLYQWMKDR